MCCAVQQLFGFWCGRAFQRVSVACVSTTQLVGCAEGGECSFHVLVDDSKKAHILGKRNGITKSFGFSNVGASLLFARTFPQSFAIDALRLRGIS